VYAHRHNQQRVYCNAKSTSYGIHRINSRTKHGTKSSSSATRSGMRSPIGPETSRGCFDTSGTFYNPLDNVVLQKTIPDESTESGVVTTSDTCSAVLKHMHINIHARTPKEVTQVNHSTTKRHQKISATQETAEPRPLQPVVHLKLQHNGYGTGREGRTPTLLHIVRR
jgi:hypothetical protein